VLILRGILLVAARADGDQVGGNGHAVRDSYVQNRFEGSQVGGSGNVQALEQGFEIVFAAHVFHCCLGSEGRRARQNQNGPRGIQARKQAHDGIVVGGWLIGRSSHEERLFSRLGMNVDHREISLAGAGVQALEYKILGTRNIEQREILGW
jgi:hypothetical protein